MSQHTPEPWSREPLPYYDLIRGPDGQPVAYTAGVIRGTDPRTIDSQVATSQRIVLCVNACRGIDAETLERIARGELRFRVEPA